MCCRCSTANALLKINASSRERCRGTWPLLGSREEPLSSEVTPGKAGPWISEDMTPQETPLLELLTALVEPLQPSVRELWNSLCKVPGINTQRCAEGASGGQGLCCKRRQGRSRGMRPLPEAQSPGGTAPANEYHWDPPSTTYDICTGDSFSTPRRHERPVSISGSHRPSRVSVATLVLGPPPGPSTQIGSST